jgi:hypothetical protein
MALFVQLPVRRLSLTLPSAEVRSSDRPAPDSSGLAQRRFTRRVTAAAAPAPQKVQDPVLDQMIKLTGILDFGGKQPTLAVIETSSPKESKAYKSGDRIGETGIQIKEIKEHVIVEYEKRRFKVTFVGVQELPAAALGKD